MNKKQTIEFITDCTPQQHEKAWFCVQYRCGILQFWPLIFLTSLFMIGVVVTALQTKATAELLWLIVLFSSLAVALPFVYFLIVIPYVNQRRRYYLEKYMAVGSREITVYSHSLSVKSQLVSTDIPFSDCKFLINKREFFVLVQNRRGYLIIPKNDVPQGQLKELKKRLKKGSAWYRVFHRG